MGEVETFVAKAKIRDCIVALARGEDRRSAEMVSSAYWSDARVDFGMFEGDFAAYLAWVVPGADSIPNTQHVLGQTHIEMSGDKAKAETHVISYHRVDFGEGDHHDVCMGGRYLDRFEQRGGEWRISHRTMLYDWSNDWGASIDWSQGMMGMQFSAEHFSGRAHGDYSEKFFAGE